MSKFGDDVRRIARYQELLELIRQNNNSVDQTTKSAIESARGVAYPTRNGGANTSTGTPGVTKPNNNDVTDTDNSKDTDTQDGESKPVEDPNQAPNGDVTAGDNDLSSSDNTLRDGWFDVESVLQGAKDALGKYPPKEGTKSAINALNGITDGAGRKMVVHLKEAFSSFIGPDDRDDANQRAADSSFILGRVWTNGSGVPQYSNTFSGWVSRYQVYGAGGPITKLYSTEDNGGPFSSWVITSTSPSAGDYLFASNNLNATVGQTLGSVGGTGIPYQNYAPLTTVSSGNYGQQDCGIVVSSNEAAMCNLTTEDTFGGLPNLALWVDLGATQMAWATIISAAIEPFNFSMVGKFVPHPYDVNIPNIFKDGASILDLTTDALNTVRLGPLAAGGWYLHYSDGSGNPTGDGDTASVLKINANRTHGGWITPNQLTRMKPPSS